MVELCQLFPLFHILLGPDDVDQWTKAKKIPPKFAFLRINSIDGKGGALFLGTIRCIINGFNGKV